MERLSDDKSKLISENESKLISENESKLILEDENTSIEEIDEKEPSVEEEEEVDPRSLLTKEQVQAFKEIFNNYDPQKKGAIPSKTIGYVLRLMGLNPTKTEIKKIMQEMDPLGKGLIDFQTFLLPLAQRINQEPETHEDIISAFKVLDEENNEFLYTDQLSDYLTSLGEDLEDFEIEVFLKMAETKGTGKVHYVEFVEKIMGVAKKAKKSSKAKKGAKKAKK